MNFKKLSTGAAVVMGMVLLGLSAAHANVILTYTGNDFTIFSAPYTGTDKVTASITVANPLGDGFTGAVSPLAFSLNDGVQTITNTSGPFITETFDFNTGPTGTITSWGVDVQGSLTGEIITLALSAAPGGIDSGTLGGAEGVISNKPAGWTISAVVPEPPTVSVLGAGLLGLGLFWWRRWRKLDLVQYSAQP
jgi:hypothetical protein